MTRYCDLLTFLLFLCLFSEAVTFEEESFKKCRDSSFCFRNRQEIGNRLYQILPHSVAHTESSFSAKLINTKLQTSFNLSLVSVQGAIRFQVSESTPSISRYHLQTILIHDPPLPGPSWTIERTENNVKLFLPDSTVLVTFSPFMLEIKHKRKAAIRINGNNLFHMEYGSEAAAEVDRSEAFKGFRDSRPNGAMAMSLDLTFVSIKHLFGIPLRASNVYLAPTIENGTPVSEPYRLYNLDTFLYQLNSPFGLYGSIPFLLAQGEDQAAGVFWHNAAEMYVDVWKDQSSAYSQWITESGAFDVFLITGDHSSDVIRHYTSLTGTTAMPQYFALGYHQSRWNYLDQSDIKSVDTSFDENDIPCDVLWLDIEHTDGKRYLTWDRTLFPDPETMQNNLSAHGRKLVTIVDPHFKRDEDYSVHREAEEKGYYVKTPSGDDFIGDCWPGASSYLDLIRPEVRSWWAEHFQMENYPGMTMNLYIWNDMNEPSVFDGPELTMQKDLLHAGSVEHRDIHNAYGYYYHMATGSGLASRGVQQSGLDGDRPFVLSRSFFAGSQRLGATWTGDNGAYWSYLRASIPMLLANNLAGMAFCGADVGGFFGDPDSELFTRWYQLGIFYPFFRGHSHRDSRRREPWTYDEPTTSRVRRALKERYALLPYLYTLFRISNLTGAPIMRPLWYEFTNQELFESEEQFMLGPALMIRPVLDRGVESVETIFPRGVIWYNAWIGEAVQVHEIRTQQVAGDLEQIPFYYKGGSIIPRKEHVRPSTQTMISDPVTLVVALDGQNEAEGELYLDDGHSFAFQRGQYRHRKFTFSSNALRSREVSDNEGTSYRANISIDKIIVLGLTHSYTVHEETSEQEFATSLGTLRTEQAGESSAVVLAVETESLSVDEDWTLIFSLPNQ